MRVDPSKSLGAFSELKLLRAYEEQGLRFGGGGASHPGDRLASGRLFQKKVTWEKNNRRWEYKGRRGWRGESVGSWGVFGAVAEGS